LLRKSDCRNKNEERVMFKFHEGQSVSLRIDYPALGMKAGEVGVVWAAYATDPASYEVTFRHADTDTFDMTVTEGDLLAIDSSMTGRSRKATKRQVEAA
jgi:hypothetical protein